MSRKLTSRSAGAVLALSLALLPSSALAGGHGVVPQGTVNASGPTKTPPSTAAPAPSRLSLTHNVRRTVLDNGLTVLTKEVRGAPVVSVQVFYKIGSRNEAPGVNGIAHQLEHMMFKGTLDRPVQFGRLLGALGADFNAFTYYDQTAYHETVERSKAGAALQLEADRMANALIDPAGLNSERNVVLSEIEGDENDPAYRLERAVQAAAFAGSPYGLTVGGTRRDIEGFTAEKVSSYYKKYYSPEYATVIVVGDFKTDDMLRQVQEAFGQLGRPGTAPVGVSAPLVAGGSEATLGKAPPKAPIILRQSGTTPLLNAVYPLPDVHSPDSAALKVLDELLLAGRTSRLYQALFEGGLAADGGTVPYQFARGGWYSFSFTPTPGTDIRTLDAALLKVIAELRDQPVSREEVERAKTRITARTLLETRSVSAQATSLGMDATTAGDYRYTDRLLADLQKVTPADVQRVARTYLADDRRTTGYFEPTQTAQNKGGGAQAGGATREAFNAGPPVDPGQVARYLPPVAAGDHTQVTLPQQIKLSNGLTVLLLRDSSTPTVTLSALVQAGREYDTDRQAGLVDLVADNLLSGTQSRDELTLARTLDSAGAVLTPEVSRDSVSLSGAAPDGQLPALLDVLSDVLQHATFPAAQFGQAQARAVQAVKQSEDSPSDVAQKVFRKTVYPAGNPWQVFSTPQSVAGLKRQDALNFYRSHYRPESTVLTLIGNFDPAQARVLIERKLGGWKASGPAPRPNYAVIGKPGGVVRANPVLPGKTQAVTYLGYQGISRLDPRYFPALVLNDVLGGSTLSSRLGTQLRDKEGLTYGVYSSFAALRQPGAFSVVMQTNPQDTEKAVQGVLAIMRDVRDHGLSDTEVNTAKNGLASAYTVGLADTDALASVLGRLTALGLPLSEVTDYQAKIAAVTPQQVASAAKELLDPNHVVVVTAGPNSR